MLEAEQVYNKQLVSVNHTCSKYSKTSKVELRLFDTVDSENKAYLGNILITVHKTLLSIKLWSLRDASFTHPKHCLVEKQMIIMIMYTFISTSL